MKHYAQFVAQFMTEDVNTFTEGPLPQPPPPKRRRGTPTDPTLPAPAAKPPRPKARGPYKTPPAAPGSSRDVAEKERAAKAEKQRQGERRNRNPFGDSLMREISKMMQG